MKSDAMSSYLLRAVFVFFYSVGNYNNYQSEAKRILQMGVLLPYTGSLPIGLGISGAVPLAVNFISSDPRFEYFRKNYDLNYTIVDCPCDTGPGLVAFSNTLLQTDPKIDVFIGKQIFFNKPIQCLMLICTENFKSLLL